MKSKWTGSSGRSEPKLNSTPTPNTSQISITKTTSHKMLLYVLFGGDRTEPQLPKQRPDRRDEASSTTKPPGELLLEPAGRVELLAGAAGYKTGRPSSYTVCGVRTSGKTLSGDINSDPDLREVGLERRADS
ncbi:hypothetical protein B0H19DRAFT_1055399 [Mycena capillaripes]|nr:hypothetical protein B0H19DRAFT_1055399 [Mycena capillaripes]